MNPHILIVDDDEMVLTGLAENLEREGFRATTAASGREALDALARAPDIHLILTDLVMEEMDGLTLLKRVNELKPDIPVIVITGHGTAASAFDAVRQGAADYIQKPARPEDIAGRIRSVLDAQELQKRLLAERDSARERREERHARTLRGERMESLKLLAEGTADELEEVRRQLAASDAGAADGARERLERLVDDLRRLHQGEIIQAVRLDLNRVIREFLQSEGFRRLEADAPRVTVETRLQDNLPQIEGSAAHLQESLHMLIACAFDACAGQGCVRLSTALEHHDTAAQGLYVEAKPGWYAVVRIEHPGHLGTADVDRAFEPFYACRFMERRSAGGFGLARVYASIRAHQGLVEVTSSAAAGTTCTLRFPVPDDAAGARGAEQTLRGSGRVLVVDDNEACRAEAQTLLASLGYQVVMAASAAEALKRIDAGLSHPDQGFDLVVLDLVLGEARDGVDLFQEIRKRQPQQKAILAGGFADTDRIAEARRLGLSTYVRKPFSLDALGRAVRHALAG